MAEPNRYSHEDYRLAWICALPHKLAATKAMFDETMRPSSQLALVLATHLEGYVGYLNKSTATKGLSSSGPQWIRPLHDQEQEARQSTKWPRRYYSVGKE